ncbi:MAG TPA: transposase, partial [Casimicrobiaceae bacterium]|nr:transposase [Casimicrobiaceae bacterium]
RFSWQGVGLMLAVNLFLFGPIGASIWAMQMLWIPFWAAGVINGIGHYWGYRNFASADTSTNISPWGILVGGEELHNNHHAYGSSAKFSSRWWEFDLGWGYIRLLSMVKLATVRKVAPKLVMTRAKPVPDLSTLQAVITHRYAVATSYARSLRRTCAAEIEHLRKRVQRGELQGVEVPTLRRLKRWLSSEPSALPPAERARLAKALAASTPLAKIYAMREELSALWTRSTESSEQLLARLQDWCHRAERSGIESLATFSLTLRRYA